MRCSQFKIDAFFGFHTSSCILQTSRFIILNMVHNRKCKNGIDALVDRGGLETLCIPRNMYTLSLWHAQLQTMNTANWIADLKNLSLNKLQISWSYWRWRLFTCCFNNLSSHILYSLDFTQVVVFFKLHDLLS